MSTTHPSDQVEPEGVEDADQQPPGGASADNWDAAFFGCDGDGRVDMNDARPPARRDREITHLFARITWGRA